MAIPPVALALVLPLLISPGIYTWELRATEDTVMTPANPRYPNDRAAAPRPPHS